MTNEELRERMNKHVPTTGVMFGQHIEWIDQEKGAVRVRYLAKPEFCNPMGSVQGGLIASMLDDAAAFACIARAQMRIGVPTLEFKVSFLAPAKAGILFVEARVKKFGRTICFVDSDMTDEQGKLLASMTTTVMPITPTAEPNLVARA